MFKRKNQKAEPEPPTDDLLSIDLNRDTVYEPNGKSNRLNPLRGQPPSRPPRRRLPSLPRQFANSDTVPQPKTNIFRPASSIYSQPSPVSPTDRFPGNAQHYHPQAYADPNEVSPPSSPELSPYTKERDYQSDGSISPMDDIPDMSRLAFSKSRDKQEVTSKPTSSNIPILRRKKKREQVANVAANFRSKRTGEGRVKQIMDPRWDPYTGEQTLSEQGKPQSMKPKEYTSFGHRVVHPHTGLLLGNESTVSASNNQSFSERVKKQDVEKSPLEKPEWKGAIGRQAIVSPVAECRDMPPFRIPRKSHNPVNSGSNNLILSTQRSDSEIDHAPPSFSKPADTMNRAVIIKDVRGDCYSATKSSEPSNGLPTQSRSISTESAPQFRGCGSAVQHPTTLSQKREDSTTTIERNFHEALRNVNLPSLDTTYEQPPSRFSVTTYATSESHSSPRQSMESYNKTHHTPPIPQNPSPILNRKRPKYASDSLNTSHKATTRKAVSCGSPMMINMRSSLASSHPSPAMLSSVTDSNPRISDVTKSLPQSPAEASSHDLISSLQAQQESLQHRRNNITRSIRQMTELMPTDHVVLTEEVRAKREMEKMKVHRMREEEADVRRKEHEIGLRLHRAWKRRDKEAMFEPTGLWVRRLTEYAYERVISDSFTCNYFGGCLAIIACA